MSRLLEEYSNLPPRHDAPRRADHVVAVRTFPGGATGAMAAGAGLVKRGGAVDAGSHELPRGYALELVSVEGPKCVGVGLKVERRIDQLVVDLTKRDASIRLPLKTPGEGGGGKRH